MTNLDDCANFFPNHGEAFYKVVAAPLKFKELLAWDGKTHGRTFTGTPQQLGERVLFRSLVEETRCFVMEPNLLDGDFDDRGKMSLSAAPLGRLDLPFRTCCFEVRGRELCVFPGGPLAPAAVVVCVWIHELTPQRYLLAALEGVQNHGQCGMSPSVWSEDISSDFWKMSFVVQRLLMLLTQSELGVEQNRPNCNIGRGKAKCTVRPRQVVRVALKKDRATIEPIFGGSVDWTHRWEVRGHWRRTNGIGKDRDGVFGVSGFTWVVPHTKGAEGMPVMKKIRHLVVAQTTAKQHTEREANNGG